MYFFFRINDIIEIYIYIYMKLGMNKFSGVNEYVIRILMMIIIQIPYSLFPNGKS